MLAMKKDRGLVSWTWDKVAMDTENTFTNFYWRNCFAILFIRYTNAKLTAVNMQYDTSKVHPITFNSYHHDSIDTSTVKLSSTDPLNDMHNYYSFIPQLTFMKRTMKMSRILALDYVKFTL